MCFVCIETLPLIRLFEWLRATWVPKDPQSQKDSGALWVGELTGRTTPALFVPLTWTAGLFYPAFAAGNKWSWPRKGGGNLVVVSISSCSDVLYLKSLFNFPCPWPLPSSLAHSPSSFSLVFTIPGHYLSTPLTGQRQGDWRYLTAFTGIAFPPKISF